MRPTLMVFSDKDDVVAVCGCRGKAPGAHVRCLAALSELASERRSVRGREPSWSSCTQCGLLDLAGGLLELGASRRFPRENTDSAPSGHPTFEVALREFTCPDEPRTPHDDGRGPSPRRSTVRTKKYDPQNVMRKIGFEDLLTSPLWAVSDLLVVTIELGTYTHSLSLRKCGRSYTTGHPVLEMCLWFEENEASPP